MPDSGKRSIFSGMRVLIDQKWAAKQAVVVEEEVIKAIVPDNMLDHHLPARVHKFPSDYYLVPGFIDLHVHGARGKDVMDGDKEALVSISHALAEEGVTRFLATTMTADAPHIEKVLQVIQSVMASKEGAAILGIHLEGPFIAKTKLGAQPNQQQLPDPALMQKWQKQAGGNIKIVTLAPELPGALPLIKVLQNMQVVASIGHTDATYAETCAAIAAGCSEATHVFNAMRGLHQREPGAAGAVLLSDRVAAELIADGMHLHPAIVDLVYRLKHKEHLLLVTDAMRAKHLGDGHYELGGQQVEVRAGKPTLADGTLAGSTLTMPQAIKNMVKFSNCSLIDAIEMATWNPANVLGLTQRKATIDAGKDADLVILNADFEVKMTVRSGEIVCRGD